MKTPARLFAALVLFVAATAHAGVVSGKLGIIQPYTGMYYDPHQSGSGLYVDIGPTSNRLFMIFATYDQAGNQVNYITQPIYQPSSEADLIASGTIGRTTGTFLQVTNGQCPGCPYRAPAVTVTPLTADFVWASPRHLTMTFGTNVYHFDAANYEDLSFTDEEFLPGTYALSFANDDSVYPGAPATNTLNTELAIMRIAPAPFGMAQLTLDPASPADVQLPPAGAHLYTLDCAGNQIGPEDGACNSVLLIWTNTVPGSQHNPIPRGTAKALVWYDPASASAGLDIYELDNAGHPRIGPANFHMRLYITPTQLQGHLVAHGARGVAAVIDGTVGAVLNFTRLPTSAVRDCYDYSAPVCQ